MSELEINALIGKAIVEWMQTASTDLSRKGLSNLREIGYRICLYDIRKVIDQAKAVKP